MSSKGCITNITIDGCRLDLRLGCCYDIILPDDTNEQTKRHKKCVSRFWSTKYIVLYVLWKCRVFCMVRESESVTKWKYFSFKILVLYFIGTIYWMSDWYPVLKVISGTNQYPRDTIHKPGEDRRYVGDRRCIKHQNQNQKHKNEWMNHQPIIIHHI